MKEKKNEKEKESSLEIDKIGERALDNAYISAELTREDIKKYEDMRTLFGQDYEAWKRAKEKGLDVKNSFRVMRSGNEGENPHYHVFSTKGNEKGVEEELKLMRSRRYIVDNDSVESYKMKEEDKGPWTRKIEEMAERKMRKMIREEIMKAHEERSKRRLV